MKKVVRILIADDDSEDRFIMGDAFSETGLTEMVGFVENGESLISSLDQIQETSELPSLIVLDMNMPRMNGTQTLGLLKNDKRYKNIPVIIFSTSMNSIEMKECMDIGAAAYIIKPVTYKECIGMAQKFYEFSKTNELSAIA